MIEPDKWPKSATGLSAKPPFIIRDSDFNIEWNGALKVVHKEANLSINLSNNSSAKVCHDAQLDASKSNSLYVDDLSEIRVNALCGYMLIRYT